MNLRQKFPSDFVWGTATSAYQIEGGAQQGGRGLSIWDTFCATPGKVAHGHTGDIACDHFNRFQEDVAMMANMGASAYRFSIAWPRIMPNGRVDSLNQEGIDFYNRLIDECIDHGIDPWITLYHWDLPQQLHDDLDGWLSPELPDLFAEYAQACFTAFGDRVKHWITINEAWVVSILGYGQGVFAPGYVSNRKPYQVGHHLLLAHAKAVKCYRDYFQKQQGGVIGISNNCDWREPKSDRPEDIAAAHRALDFFLGWFADPIYLGEYPQTMRENVAERLPEITAAERELIQGSSDFFGLNHYTTMYAAQASNGGGEQSVYGNGGLNEDQHIDLSVDPDWQKTDMQWAVVPWGCRKLLHWINDRYQQPPIYLTENGCAYDDAPVDGEVADTRRIEFYQAYLEECAKAIDEGVNLKGYFAWSFMDNFEWASGYDMRFGLHYVDFATGKRTAKNSALWFQQQLATG